MTRGYTELRVVSVRSALQKPLVRLETRRYGERVPRFSRRAVRCGEDTIRGIITLDLISCT